MSLWDFLTNNTKKQEYPEITPIQVADNGAIDYQKSLELAMAQPKSFMENFKGRTVSIDVPTDITNNNEISLSKISKFQPGLLNDISAGAKENYTDAFSNSNWEKTRTSDGRQKGFGYRLGEGLGSIARFANTPWGRGLLMAGVVGATGGGALPAITFGADAGFGNKQNRTNDRLYRDALNAQGVDTSNIRGFVSDKAFNQLLTAKQLRDNAEYRNLYLDSQLRNQELANQIARERLDYQKYSDSADRNLKSRSLDLEEQKANQPKPLSDSQVKDLKGTTDFLTSLENIESRYSNDKYDSMFGIKGDIRRNNPLSRYDAEASLFKQDVEILRQRYAKLLEGGRLSDSDRAFYQKALFNPNVSRADFLEAVRRMKATLMQDYNNALSLYSKQGKDIAGFELTPTQPAQQTTQNISIDRNALEAEMKRRGLK